mmetsp:Transcript_54810/g.125359  ORF Transcript_54810/g.125359 Transcript_54810/m.125359 type:complete len:327 (-) Transcript_54810:1043-2023(-)
MRQRRRPQARAWRPKPRGRGRGRRGSLAARQRLGSRRAAIRKPARHVAQKSRRRMSGWRRDRGRARATSRRPRRHGATYGAARAGAADGSRTGGSGALLTQHIQHCGTVPGDSPPDFQRERSSHCQRSRGEDQGHNWRAPSAATAASLVDESVESVLPHDHELALLRSVSKGCVDDGGAAHAIIGAGIAPCIPGHAEAVLHRVPAPAACLARLVHAAVLEAANGRRQFMAGAGPAEANLLVHGHVLDAVRLSVLARRRRPTPGHVPSGPVAIEGTRIVPAALVLALSLARHSSLKQITVATVLVERILQLRLEQEGDLLGAFARTA